MDQPTVRIYERASADYEARRKPQALPEAHAFGARCAEGPVVDLGCGPGWYTAALGSRPVALDAAMAMLRRTRDVASGSLLVQAELEALPFRRGSLTGGWARNSYVHLSSTAVPLALADLHRSLAMDAAVELTFFGGDSEGREVFPGDDFPGRWFSTWSPQRLRDVVVGAGFRSEELAERNRDREEVGLTVRATRARTLADTVGPSMRLLVCGLNPSLRAADAGMGFFTPGNRFWPAAMEAGLVTRDRDPVHALRVHGVGMTDLVKRATPQAAALSRDEFGAGLDRVDRLCAWLEPAAVCMVGLAGWRAGVDRHASPGWQERPLGGRPVYLMPSTSGLNAATPLEDLVRHLRATLD